MAYSVDCQGLIDGCSDPFVAVSCVLGSSHASAFASQARSGLGPLAVPPCVYLFLCAGWSEKVGRGRGPGQGFLPIAGEGGAGVVVISRVGGGKAGVPGPARGHEGGDRGQAVAV